MSGTPERAGQRAFLGMPDQKRKENVRPAKKVKPARATCPLRRPRTAEAVQQNMITRINEMISMRRWSGVIMAGK